MHTKASRENLVVLSTSDHSSRGICGGDVFGLQWSGNGSSEIPFKTCIGSANRRLRKRWLRLVSRRSVVGEIVSNSLGKENEACGLGWMRGKNVVTSTNGDRE